MTLSPPKSGLFCYKSVPKGQIYNKRFLQNLAWGGSPRCAPLRQILPLWLLKCGVTVHPQNRQKMVIFGINLPIMGKFKGFIEKLDYRCTTTNLPLCNGTIIVLKITLLHSVSVNINFIIPKRDKRQTKKRHTFSSTAGALSMIPTILGTGGPCHICTPLTFSEPIRSFPAKGYL